MRLGFAVVALGAASAAHGADAVPMADLTWSTLSPNAALELKQTAVAPEVCHIACTGEAGTKVLWEADICLANKNQLRFLANDGEKVIVLEPLPARSQTWKTVPVVFLYHHTDLEKTAVAAALVHDTTKLRELTKHFYWLGGEEGIPGKPATSRDDGTGVDLEIIDGRNVTIHFDGSAFPQPPPPPKKKHGKSKPK